MTSEADVLRRAAAAMRERAQAARDVTGAGDWHVATAWAVDESPAGGWVCYSVRSSGGRVSSHSAEEEAEHIASWHPAVAVAVADWLDHEANMHADDGLLAPNCDNLPHALALARAYLGEQESP